jgi:2-methylcitrate dehydratase
MVMYPGGHARNTTADLKGILRHKFNLLGKLVQDNPADLIARFEKLDAKSADQIRDLHDFTYNTRDGYE